MPGPNSQACPKVPAGKLSLQQERELKRVNRMLGAKGVVATTRKQKAQRVSTDERANKQIVRLRDQCCRFPQCPCQRGEVFGLDVMPEVAHVRDKSLGGTDLPSNMILLCHQIHQAASGSVHSKHVRMEPLTPAGTAGQVAFYVVHPETGEEYLAGITSPPEFET
jgi:5-methylcytosine-specific restriction endonuclease McrA